MSNNSVNSGEALTYYDEGNPELRLVVMKMKVKCKICGKIKNIKPYEFHKNKTGNFYCGLECMKIGHSSNYSGSNNVFYGKKHTPESLEKMTGKNHWNYGNRTAEMNIIACKNCGKEFKWNPKKYRKEQRDQRQFCSRECRYAYDKSTRIQRNCDWCGKSVERTAYYASQKHIFCNYNCVGKWSGNRQPSGENAYWYGKRGKGTPNWKDGLSCEHYTPEFNGQLKELIRLRDGYKCQRCGCPEIEENRKLSIHHIDYNKKNCEPNNLISLCRSCNSEVNGNRQKWTRYFQKKVKKIMESNSIQLNFRFKKHTTFINHKQQSATTIPKGSTLQANGSGSAEYPDKRDNDIVCSYRKL